MITASLILSTLALLFGKWFGRINPARSSRLTAGMLLIILIAPFLLLAPKINLNLPGLARNTSSVVNPPDPHTSTTIHAIWIAISVILIVRLYIHHHATKKWLKGSTPHNSHRLAEILQQSLHKLDIGKPSRLLLSPNIKSPIVTGLLRPTILLPENALFWPQETIRIAILHELGHIRRRDLWKFLAAEMTCAIHWFNPFVWLLKKQLVAQAEFACDAHVISTGTDARTYALALCDVAAIAKNKPAPPAALAMAGQAQLKKRVEILLAGKPKTNTLLTTAILTLTASTTLAITLIRPTPPTPTPSAQPLENYTQNEVRTRLTANPFPND